MAALTFLPPAAASLPAAHPMAIQEALNSGTTLNCQTAFILVSASPVTLEATAAFSLSSDKVTCTYQLSE